MTQRIVMMVGALCTVGMIVWVVADWPNIATQFGRSKGGYPSESDEDALRFFNAHRSQFNRLKELVESRPIIFYHMGRREAIPEDVFKHSPGTEEEILSLMGELNIQFLNGAASSWGLRMAYLAEGYVMAGTTRSFFYCSEMPTRVVEEIEGHFPDGEDRKRVFRKIGDGWYLTFDWGG